MYLFILIFFIIILILQVNVHIFFKSMGDTVKMYMSIGLIHIEIPHHKLLAKLNSKKMKNIKVKRTNRLTNLFLSHSVLDHFYISKSSSIDLASNGINNALFLVLAYELKGLLFSKCRLVENNQINLRYDEAYENIDYYFDIHISIINIIIVSIKSIFKR